MVNGHSESKSRKTAITSCCVGRSFAGHKLPDKLQAIKDAGFQGVEIFIEDLEAFAHDLSDKRDLPFSSSFSGNPVNPPSQDELIVAAKETKRLCAEIGLEIPVYQPFQHFEGELVPEKQAAKLKEAESLLELCGLLGAKIFQVTCHYRKDGTTGDVEVLARDLSKLADMAATVGAKVAYETIAWGAYCNTWQRSYEVIKTANNPNLGLILDTYHLLGKLWADPTSSTGILGSREEADARLQDSMDELARTVPGDQIFYVQLSDVLYPKEPFTPKHPFYDEALFGPLHMWSRQGRPFPFEGYAPVEVCAKAIAATGFDGYWSIETFSYETREAGSGVPVEQAKRAMQSWKKLEQML